MKWYEKTEYALLLLTTITAPLDWRLATIGMILLGVSAVFKIFKSKHFGNPALSTPARIVAVSMMAFFAVSTLSASLSNNQPYGWDIAFSRVYFLVFPLLSLAGNSTYLSRPRIRILFYTLFATLVVLFFVRSGVTIVKMAQGTPLTSLLDSHFYSTHHTYFALYLSIAFALAASEIIRILNENENQNGNRLPPNSQFSTTQAIKQSSNQAILTKLSIPLLFVLLVLALFALAVNSRAGILAISLITLASLVYLHFSLHNWRITLPVTTLVVACALALFFLQPENRHRLTNTFKDVSSEEPKDARLTLTRYGLEVAEYDMYGWEWVFGLGEGDMKEHLFTRYATHGYKNGVKENLRTHNQYLETFLASGALGLAVLLFFLLSPLFGIRRLPREDRLPVLSVVFPTILFLATEMMLYRQMGIVFIAFSYYLLILWYQKPSDNQQINNAIPRPSTAVPTP